MGKRHRLNRCQLSPEQSSYSIRIVCAHERHRGTSIEDTARMMNCSESSVYRYKARFDESGDVARASYSRDNALIRRNSVLCSVPLMMRKTRHSGVRGLNGYTREWTRHFIL